jgi:Tfp pilus assembly protein PilZ
MEDRRKSSRMSVDWSVMITTREGSMEGEVKNVSSTGAFIQCEKPLSAKQRCRLKINLPNGHVEEFRAQVVWSTPPGAGDESTSRGMGVKFLW